MNLERSKGYYNLYQFSQTSWLWIRD